MLKFLLSISIFKAKKANNQSFQVVEAKNAGVAGQILQSIFYWNFFNLTYQSSYESNLNSNFKK